MTYPYRIRSPEVWAQARDEYLSGLDAETVCRRHELGLSAFRSRARKYGWRRRDQPGAAPGVQDALMIYDDLSIYEEVETARLRFVQALERGKSMEAVRWRRLWQEMKAESDAMDAIAFPGEIFPEFRLSANDQPEDGETEEEVRLLSGDPEAPLAPPFPDAAEPDVRGQEGLEWRDDPGLGGTMWDETQS
ncbi:hypothetical protein [Brevundimonas sp.]|uniref:hypothetical protein n=1 Tax=Brevundimonas sp. TaxID=1871086 RepID=UPI003F6E8E97